MYCFIVFDVLYMRCLFVVLFVYAFSASCSVKSGYFNFSYFVLSVLNLCRILYVV